jgi:hypothetical protein
MELLYISELFMLHIGFLGFLLGGFFDFEDGDEVFLRNVG